MLHGSSLYMIAIVGQRVASLLLVPVLTSHLTPANYGVLDLIEQVNTLIGVLLGVNFSLALGRFYFAPEVQTPAQKGRVVSTMMGGSLLLGALAGLLGLALSETLSTLLHVSEYLVFMRLIFAFMPLAFLLEAGLGWMRTENRTALYAGMVLARLAVVVIATLWLVGALDYKVGGVVGANTGALALTAVCATVLGIRRHGMAFDLPLFRKMVRYAFPLSLSAMALFVMHFGDRLILPAYRTFDEIGVYSIAYKFGMLIALVHSSFNSYWEAQIFQIIRRPDAAPVFARTFTYMMTVLSFCGLGVLVASRPAIHLLTTPAYYGAIRLVPVLLAAYYIRAIGDYFRALFLASGKPSYDALCNWIGAAACLAGYLLLIPRWGTMGASVATLLGFLLVGITAVYGAGRVWPYQVEGVRLMKLAVVTVGLAAIYFTFPDASVIVEIGQGVLLLGAFVGILLMWGFLASKEKEAAIVMMSRFTRFSQIDELKKQ